jgi:hypothetical protein
LLKKNCRTGTLGPNKNGALFKGLLSPRVIMPQQLPGAGRLARKEQFAKVLFSCSEHKTG